jgi:sporulation-control protein
MKKILSSIGIGSASVDLLLPKTTVEQGETLDAELRVNGGSTEQEVDAVKYAVRSKYPDDDSTRTGTVSKGTLASGFTIQPDEERTIDVDVEIPANTPVTRGGDPVWIDTALDIDRAVDPDDEDRIQVEAAPRLSATVQAMESLGFHLGSVGNETVRRSSVTQEFEFKSRSGPFAGDLDELELVPTPHGDRLDLSLEVDRSGGMLSEMAGTDESHTTLTVTEADPDAIEADLRRTIEEFS